MQSETVRKREQDLQKVKKEMELLNVQHEANEQALKKRQQEQLNEVNEQLERVNKQKSKYASHANNIWVGQAKARIKSDLCLICTEP